jgi:division protein CdvB (Snf7/Vps24/ESCRT-III family)
MSKRFVQDWSTERKLPLKERVAATINPVPLRQKITKTIFNLSRVQKKLDSSHTRMEQKEKSIFNKCVKAQQSKNSLRAAMYANECAEIRKMTKSIVMGQLALEQVVLRLETVKDFGDVAVEAVPALNVIRSVSAHLSGIFPEISYQLGSIGSELNNLILEVGGTTGMSWDVVSSGEEAEKILEEAMTVAGQKMKERFPELPVSTPEPDLEREMKP